MVTALALGAAFAYGIADFMGGAASRRTAVLRVLLISVPAGVVCLTVASIVAGGTPTPSGLAWGAASGLAGGAGLITFYRALAQGPMSVIAPVSALTAAVLPVAVGTLRGERLDTGVLAGVVLCVIAIGLVSMEAPKPAAAGPQTAPGASPAVAGRTTRLLRRAAGNGPVLAAVSGAAFGTFFVLLHQAGDDSGLWPTMAARLAGLGVVVAAFVARRVHHHRVRSGGTPAIPANDPPSGGLHTLRSLGGPTLALAIVSGLLDGLANALYFMAARQGMLSLAAVLTSLYPAITVLLARLLYSERLRVVQHIGLAVAVAGVALVTAG
ncbi:Uncharacterized membrane protein [Thermomonospora echinospora]|uniref:Uncharacterized membrane protein n=1 Tax=Thermomonospora echinospora TaxID=1992 RepID=A0A1H6DC79_9ACTN|nr:EamA family transporter [Thermomonospora echinospora]SEG82794.1 Uncharacterized membrane protein [Thermomonospora echinospora]